MIVLVIMEVMDRGDEDDGMEMGWNRGIVWVSTLRVQMAEQGRGDSGPWAGFPVGVGVAARWGVRIQWTSSEKVEQVTASEWASAGCQQLQ